MLGGPIATHPSSNSLVFPTLCVEHSIFLKDVPDVSRKSAHSSKCSLHCVLRYVPIHHPPETIQLLILFLVTPRVNGCLVGAITTGAYCLQSVLGQDPGTLFTPAGNWIFIPQNMLYIPTYCIGFEPWPYPHDIRDSSAHPPVLLAPKCSTTALSSTSSGCPSRAEAQTTLGAATRHSSAVSSGSSAVNFATAWRDSDLASGSES